jgi:hypothetical protein
LAPPIRTTLWNSVITEFVEPGKRGDVDAS